MQSGPLVQFIDTDEREDHADISIQFSCSVRYVSNTPASHGSSTTITLRLGPDCGIPLGYVPPELPLVGGGGHLVTGARVDSIVPGQVTLELTWSRELDFVMAPTASGLGLRVRLLGARAIARAACLVAEVQAPEGYAVNLDSSLTEFDRATRRGGGGAASRRKPTCPRPISRTSTGTACASDRSRRARKPSECCKSRKPTIRAPGSRSTMSRPI